MLEGTWRKERNVEQGKKKIHEGAWKECRKARIEYTKICREEMIYENIVNKQKTINCPLNS